MMSAESKYGSPWSRDELVLALYLYCQTPFARTKANNPEVVRLARLLERTPSAVARKLGNLGAFDPALAKAGIRGLVHVGQGDARVWEEFQDRWDELAVEAGHLLERAQALVLEPEEKRPGQLAARAEHIGPTEGRGITATRLCQSFFRRAVLASYDAACCICGLDLPQLLVASHIVPWATEEKARADPHNGLCLCALHDRAFDRGLLGIDPALRVSVCSHVRGSTAPFAQITVLDFDGKSIRPPRRFRPGSEYLEWHWHNVFLQGQPPS